MIRLQESSVIDPMSMTVTDINLPQAIFVVMLAVVSSFPNVPNLRSEEEAAPNER